MSRPADNRSGRRHRHVAEIRYAVGASERFFGGRMQDYSRGGMRFEAGYALSPGDEILILPTSDPLPAGIGRRRPLAARVRWCRPVPHTRAFFYDVGVQFR